MIVNNHFDRNDFKLFKHIINFLQESVDLILKKLNFLIRVNITKFYFLKRDIQYMYNLKLIKTLERLLIILFHFGNKLLLFYSQLFYFKKGSHLKCNSKYYI